LIAHCTTVQHITHNLKTQSKPLKIGIASCNAIGVAHTRVVGDRVMPPVIAVRVGGPPPGVPQVIPVAANVVAAPPRPQSDGTHRLNHKKLHVTQASLAVDEISNEQVLAMAMTRGELVEFSIGDELHPTPSDPNRPRHKHYFLHYRKAIQHRDARFCQLFDMRGAEGRVLHPHIQGVGPTKADRTKVIYYTQKDKLYIASPNLLNYGQETEESPSWAIEMNHARTVDEGMRVLMHRYPGVYYTSAGRVREALELRIGRAEPARFPLSAFTMPPIPTSLLARVHEPVTFHHKQGVVVWAKKE